MPSKTEESTRQTVGNPELPAPTITSVRPYGNDLGQETMVEVRGTTELFSDVIVTVINDEISKQSYASVDYETGEFICRIVVGESGTYIVKAFSELGQTKSIEMTHDKEVTIDITNVNDEGNSNYTSFYEAFPSETPNIFFDTSNPKVIGDDGRYIFTNYQEGQYITYKAGAAKTHANVYGYFDAGVKEAYESYGITQEMYENMAEDLKNQGYYDFDFYVSQDNKTWRKANFTKVEESIENSSWIRVIYDLNFEENTYLKIVFNQTFIDYPELENVGPYIPQLGAVVMNNEVTGDPDTEEVENQEPIDEGDNDKGTIVDGVESIKEGLSTTQIVLIISGSVVLLLGAGFGVWFYFKRNQ